MIWRVLIVAFFCCALAGGANAWLVQNPTTLVACATGFVFDWTDATGCQAITAVIR